MADTVKMELAGGFYDGDSVEKALSASFTGSGIDFYESFLTKDLAPSGTWDVDLPGNNPARLIFVKSIEGKPGVEWSLDSGTTYYPADPFALLCAGSVGLDTSTYTTITIRNSGATECKVGVAFVAYAT